MTTIEPTGIERGEMSHRRTIMASANSSSMIHRSNAQSTLDSLEYTEQLISTSTAETILYYMQYSYPLVLLMLFLTLFTAYGIISSNAAKSLADSPKLTGPGGKPLPNNIHVSKDSKKGRDGFSSVRRLVFAWLSAGLIATFISNAANVLVHALAERQVQWWCGEATVVSYTRFLTSHNANNWDFQDLYRSLCILVFSVLDFNR